MFETPVVVIFYKRPEKLKQILARLEKVQPKFLYFIADGPKDESESAPVEAARLLVEEAHWLGEVTKIYSDRNLGLRERVLTGLDTVFAKENRAIILEDDCLPGEHFFQFSEQLLEHFKDETRISIISGNNFAPKPSARLSYYFSSHTNIWGWATWSKSWWAFRSEMPERELADREIEQIARSVVGWLQKRTFVSLLRKSRTLDSWAVQFAAYNYLKEKVSVVPKSNLVTNVGFGHGSTHTKFESWADEIPVGELDFPLSHPPRVEPNFLEMQRESLLKLRRWALFPILHPIESISRLWRYFMPE